MDYQIEFNLDSAGSILKLINADGQLRSTPKLGSGTVYTLSSKDIGKTVTLTGNIMPLSGTYLYQTTLGTWISSDNSASWEYVGKSGSKTPSETQSIINKLIENNKRIVENNLLCARFANKLTSEEKKSLYALQVRLDERNQQLMNDQLLQSQKESTPAGYSNFANYLSNFMQSQSVGSITATIIIAAVVIAAMSTAAYWLYQYYYGESVKDVQFSDDLTKKLTAKLTAEEYQQLMKETNGLVNKAVVSERFSSFLKGGVTKLAIFGVLGYLGYNYIKKQKQNGLQKTV